MLLLASVAAILLAGVLAQSGSAQARLPDLTQMSLEELTQVQVTSVSRKEQRAWKTGAAVYIITREDIRRSGAANIPDLLRMVPGVNVARLDANKWAISIRGFNSPYADKLLVLIDGRTVYNPAFSGVFWDQQSVPLQNIDRIEVIRGPGGTVWGANAVNGVINIITLPAEETQGGLIAAGSGTRESARTFVSYGAKAGKRGFYRVYGNYFKVESGSLLNGSPAADGWHGDAGRFPFGLALVVPRCVERPGRLRRDFGRADHHSAAF